MSKKKAQVRIIGFAAMDETVTVCVLIHGKGYPLFRHGPALPGRAFGDGALDRYTGFVIGYKRPRFS
jgi:hypothetical protein